MADRLFVIDGTGYIFRSYWAIPNFTDSEGRPTGAVFGFARMLIKLLREHDPSHIVIVFDAPGKNFRNDLYPEYKANRDKAPEDLISQFPLVDDLVEAFDIPVLRIPGVEADDVMGTLARRAEAEGLEAILVSGDKDLLQLVTDRVTVYDPSKEGTDACHWYEPKDVAERFGVPPERVVDAMGLMGDSSDNVPGVEKVGPVAARKLLEEYGTMEGVYEHLADIKGKRREYLERDRDMAFLSRKLVTIDTEVAFEATLEGYRRKALDREKLAELFAHLELKSLREEFVSGEEKEEETEETDYRLVLTKDELLAVIEEMTAAGQFSVDTETTSVDPMQAELVGISLSCKAGTGYYIPVAHTTEMLFEGDEPRQTLEKDEILDFLRPLLENAEIGKIGHNIKYDLIVLKRAGIEVAGIVMDTMVGSYLTNPSRLRHNLAEVSLQYLKRKTIPISDLIGKGSKAITFDKVPIDVACGYASEDADIAWRLAEVFRTSLRECQLEFLFGEIELPLIGVLARMEMAGIAIDQAVFADLHEEIEGRLKTLETDIVELAGEPFQINSPKQLQKVLFEDLGLTPKRKTKTGYSTDVEVLEQLQDDHPLPGKMLEFRMLEKLRGTYVEALPKLLNAETGRIHTSFNQAIAVTGRLSSSGPNLQNIPVRTELGRRIREGFIPAGGDGRLISADYSQIELRVLAHLSGDDHLREAFHGDLDIHRDTAARVFGVSQEAVTRDMRRQAKAVNFGIVYGISAFGLAKNIGVSNAEAARFIEQYFSQYPGVHEWIEHTKREAKQLGYVTTMLNRRRYVPDLNSRSVNTRRAAERVAINTPVQGTAADIIKIAMVRLDKALEKTGARLLLQVHDELVLEAPAAQSEGAAALVKQIMEEALELEVPLKVDVGIGKNWAEIH